ncbi:MAG: type II toxin-antitoxin system RelE/ParE family toxin [Deltaproteobacteria bacterium]|nr:type II toxin-antitoxin system RelE/ParE family toxin [Deltaproteobacteria bacterium]
MLLEWTLKAIGDLREAGQYIAEDNPEAAEKMAKRVQEAVEYLLKHPNMGRPGRLHNTRELVISGTPFLVVYWVRGNAVQILRVLHHSRKWP